MNYFAVISFAENPKLNVKFLFIHSFIQQLFTECLLVSGTEVTTLVNKTPMSTSFKQRSLRAELTSETKSQV